MTKLTIYDNDYLNGNYIHLINSTYNKDYYYSDLDIWNNSIKSLEINRLQKI